MGFKEWAQESSESSLLSDVEVDGGYLQNPQGDSQNKFKGPSRAT